MIRKRLVARPNWPDGSGIVRALTLQMGPVGFGYVGRRRRGRQLRLAFGEARLDETGEVVPG